MPASPIAFASTNRALAIGCRPSPSPMFQDFRLGFRLLLKERGFTFLAAAVIALGICAVATQFSVVNALLLRGLPFPEPQALYSIERAVPDNTPGDRGVPQADFDEWREQQKGFEDLAGFLTGSTVNATIGTQAIRFTGAYVSPSFFRLLKVRPARGREFTDADNDSSAPKVAIVSHELWQREWGGAADILGKEFRVNGKPATVVGVMPPGFVFQGNEQLYLPVYGEFDHRGRKRNEGTTLGVLGRLRDGVSLDQATAEFTTIARRLAVAYPDTNKDFTEVKLRPLQQTIFGGDGANLMWVMLGAVVAVLLIACVNVMNMQFARTTVRAKEIAVRTALGASPGRVLRQMLCESLVLAALGGGLGVLLSLWTVDLTWAANLRLPFPLPTWMQFRLDPAVLAVVAGCTVLAAVVSTLIPAWIAARANPHLALKDGGRGNSSRLAVRLARGMVVVQIALTCALLVATLFMVRSIWNQQRVPLGYDGNAVLTARMGLFVGDYPNPADRQLFYERTLRALRERREFSEAAMTDRFRLMFSEWTPMRAEGTAYERDKDVPRAWSAAMSDRFLPALGLSVLEGREFLADDRDDKLPVAVVTATFAQKFFPGRSAVGQRIRSGEESQGRPWRTIVGVVPDMLMQGPFDKDRDGAGMLVPLTTVTDANFMSIIVRPREAGRAPLALAGALREEMAKLDANLPLYFISTPSITLDELLAGQRLMTSLFVVFGGLAVVLSGAGLYGVMSFAVSQRVPEFGIRAALGAMRSNLLGIIFREGGRSVSIGLALGLLAAGGALWMWGQAVRNFFFRVSLTDPLIYLGVATMLALVAAVACLVPALRASRVSPVVALRAD